MTTELGRDEQGHVTLLPPSDYVATWAIYDRPKDHPTKFVVREFRVHAGRAIAALKFELADTIEEARTKLPPGLVQLDRHRFDDAAIAEVWL